MLSLFAMAAPLVYLLGVIIGGILWPGYSHYSQTVSTLTEANAPNQNVMVPLFGLYNIFVILFGFGMYLAVYRTKIPVGPMLLIASGVGGLILFFFPQDPQRPLVSFAGTMHVVVAGIIALLSLLAMGAIWRHFRKDDRWAGYDTFCLMMLSIAIAFGGFGAASITTGYAGLAERISIGTILCWMEVLAIGLFRWSTRGFASSNQLKKNSE